MSEKKPCIGRESECLQTVKNLIPKNNPVFKYLEAAKPNSNANNFPDFIFDDGFIEHFQVTTARETQKGDKHKIAETEFERESKKKFENAKLEFLNSKPCPNTLSKTVLEMESPEYTYEFFINSFKRNFENHLRSLQKYNGNKAIGIFLVEHIGAGVTVLQNGKFSKFYRMEYDKELLSYLNEFADRIKYLICFWGEVVGDSSGSLAYEIIEMSKIPTMIENTPQGITFGVGCCHNIKLNLFVDI